MQRRRGATTTFRTLPSQRCCEESEFSRLRSPKKELALHIVVNDRAKPLFVIDVLALRKAVAWDKVKAQVLQPQQAQALIAGLIKTADDEDRAKEREQFVAIAAPKPAAPERLSFADEFMKLAKLRQEGALSEQEFTVLKAELIRRAKPVSA